eukprot:5146777-Lingulodinium_polyedra.AAC.1
MPEDITDIDALRGCPGATRLPAANERGLQLLPGDGLLLALRKGGCLRLDAAGERAEVIATCGAWVHIEVPAAAGTRAAEEGTTDIVVIRVRGGTG